MELNKLQKKRGFSLVEILVVSSIMLVVFGGLLISFRYSLELISHSRAKLTALTLANDGMEYIRSLSYNAVGTVSGIPSGLLLQVSTTTLNGIVFTKRVLVEYIDDDADGLGAADSNGITTDYKQAKVTLEWTLRGVTKKIFLVSNIIPKSIETDVNGGTVRVNVFDFDNAPLPGASVRLVNSTLAPTIDVTRTSDATGVALFGGAPQGGNYEIFVTAPLYSTDQTYKATTSLPNPTTLPIGVVESSVSTMNFFIDEVSSRNITILASKATNQFTENFDTVAGIASSTNTVISGGSLRLVGAPGSYVLNGTSYLSAVTPVPLVGWDYLFITGTTTNNTSARARFYTGTSSAYVLIPDTDLPGNSVGFPVGGVDISALNFLTYPAVTIGITLTSNTVNETPSVNTIILGYSETKTTWNNQSFTLRGTKTIGTLADSSPVYKHTISSNTNAQGQVVWSSIEADEYTFNVSGYEIKEVCGVGEFNINPGTNSALTVLLTANTAHSLRVGIKTATDAPVIGSQVTLSRPGYTETQVAGRCGQVYFGGITPETDYSIEVIAPPYITQTISNVTVNQDAVKIITL